MNKLIFAIELLVFSLFLVRLSFGVIKQRGANKVSVGGGEAKSLQHAIAAQSNFLNYVPIILLMHFVLVSWGVNPWWLLILAVWLLVARLLHVYSLLKTELQVPVVFRYRVLGMKLTFSCLLASAATSVWLAVSGLL